MTAPQVYTSPPTTPRARGDPIEGQALLDALPGSLDVELRFASGLCLKILAEKTTTVKQLRRGLLRAVGASLSRDEAVLLSGKGEPFDEPWHKPFRDVSGGEVFQVIVREAQTPYYQDVADRKPQTGDYH